MKSLIKIMSHSFLPTRMDRKPSKYKYEIRFIIMPTTVRVTIRKQYRKIEKECQGKIDALAKSRDLNYRHQ